MSAHWGKDLVHHSVQLYSWLGSLKANDYSVPSHWCCRGWLWWDVNRIPHWCQREAHPTCHLSFPSLLLPPDEWFQHPSDPHHVLQNSRKAASRQAVGLPYCAHYLAEWGRRRGTGAWGWRKAGGEGHSTDLQDWRNSNHAEENRHWEIKEPFFFFFFSEA